jgi:hypothetical protein
MRGSAVGVGLLVIGISLALSGHVILFLVDRRIWLGVCLLLIARSLNGRSGEV